MNKSKIKSNITLKELFLNHPIWISTIPYLLLSPIFLFIKSLNGDSAINYIPIALLLLLSPYFAFIYYLFPDINLFKNWVDSKSKNWYWCPIVFFFACVITFRFFENGNSIPFIFYTKNLSTGIIEEVLFRSICFGLLINLFKSQDKKNYIFDAALVSSVAFGAIHILNVIANISSIDLWVSTLIQVLYATFIGLGFAGHTYKNNSILIPILIHAMIDVFTDDMLQTMNIAKNSFMPLLVVVCIIGIPYVIYGIKILMDTRPKPI
jgi:membrane protease YdiL (CAAX protease family)